MLALPLVYLILFCYVPMGSLIIAFEDYSVRQGIFKSQWIGLLQFDKIFSTPTFAQLLRNTLSLSVYSFLAGFPMPILLALALNECPSRLFKKTVQSITYAPYFLSTVVVVSILTQFFHTRTGLVNNVITTLGGTARNFMGETQSFRHLYVWSGVWKSAGYSAVLYLASLSSVDASLHEAAILDGANKVQRVVHVDLPTILPTVVISMILSLGNLMSLGYEKACIQSFRKLFGAITEEVGGDSYILGCNAPFWPQLGLVHSNRETDDVFRKWETISEIAEQQFWRNWQNGTLWINDPDGVVLEKRDMSSYRRGRYRRRICELSDAEFEFHKAYIIACGGVVTSGDLLTEISERNLDVLRKMMKEVGTAAKFDDTTFTIGRIQKEDHTLICAFNWTEEPRDLVIPLDGMYRIRTLFTEKELGVYEGSYTIQNALPHEGFVLVLTPYE